MFVLFIWFVVLNCRRVSITKSFKIFGIVPLNWFDWEIVANNFHMTLTERDIIRICYFLPLRVLHIRFMYFLNVPSRMISYKFIHIRQFWMIWEWFENVYRVFWFPYSSKITGKNLLIPDNDNIIGDGNKKFLLKSYGMKC